MIFAVMHGGFQGGGVSIGPVSRTELFSFASAAGPQFISLASSNCEVGGADKARRGDNKNNSPETKSRI